jgi:hypothetical protein
MDVPLEFTQDESGSASFGISCTDHACRPRPARLDQGNNILAARGHRRVHDLPTGTDCRAGIPPRVPVLTMGNIQDGVVDTGGRLAGDFAAMFRRGNAITDDPFAP